MNLLEVTLGVLLVISFAVNFVFIKKARISKQEICSKNEQSTKGDGNVSININSPQSVIEAPK